MTQPEFGRRLREARVAAGMSQLELAGGAYTNSYVSYLESGRRVPTQEVADYLAARLGMTARQLGFRTDVATDLDAQITHALLAGDRALARHEWRSALAAAERALALAEQSARADRSWEARHLRCRTLLESGEFEAAGVAARELAFDQVGELSPRLRSEAHTLAARAMRGSGRLVEAVDEAETALSLPELDEILEVEGLLQLLAARAELGASVEHLDPIVSRLSQRCAALEPGHTRGRVLWTIGNVSHMRGDHEAGEAAHAEAATLIQPMVDLALFGRLHRVIAHFRMLAGRIDGVADELAVSRQACELVGREADLVELTVDEARLRHIGGDHLGALDVLDEALATKVMAIPFVGRAEARELRGEVLLALGRGREARVDFRGAALDYEAMRAVARAHEAWRLAAEVED